MSVYGVCIEYGGMLVFVVCNYCNFNLLFVIVIFFELIYFKFFIKFYVLFIYIFFIIVCIMYEYFYKMLYKWDIFNERINRGLLLCDKLCKVY